MKNRFLSLILMLLVLVIIPNNMVGQNNGPSQIIPPLPDAASLGKFGDWPVNNFTGLPNISIPLWQIDLDEIKVPISLSYHGGGNVLTEVPSWVGLGWALNSGGVITRSVHGIPDDALNGFISSGKKPLPAYPNIDPTVNKDFLLLAYNGGEDLEPDVFYFNFPGNSGKFVFDRNRDIHLTEFSNIKIKPIFNGYDIIAFSITAADGIQYYFSKLELNDITFSTVAPNNGPLNYSYSSYTSSWYLTEITLPYTNQKITFEYEDYYLQYELPITETKYTQISFNPNIFLAKTIEKTKALQTCPQAKRISKIVYPSGYVSFNTGSYRMDLQGSKTLDNISVFNNQGELIKKYQFKYQYGSQDIEGYGNVTSSTPSNTALRLRLKSIQEVGSDNATTKNPYLFSYDQNVLPDRLISYAQDNWGYYNGATGNTTLIPPFYLKGLYYEGAIRSSNLDYAKAEILNKIQFPTGGYSTFEYELNDIKQDPNLPVPIKTVNTQANCMITSCHLNNGSFTITDYQDKGQVIISISAGISDDKAIACGGNTTLILPACNSAERNIFCSVFNDKGIEVWSECVQIGCNTAARTLNPIILPKGVYTIKFMNHLRDGSKTQATESDANFVGTYTYSFSIFNEIPEPVSPIVGGLRIKKIINVDGITSSKQFESFNYKDDSGSSSGSTNFTSNFGYQLTENQIQLKHVVFIGSDLTEYHTNQYQVYTSSSNVPLTTVQGGIVGYNKVTVFEGNDLNNDIKCKTEYYYTNSSAKFNTMSFKIDYLTSLDKIFYLLPTLSSTPAYPFSQQISYDYKNGQLLKQIEYANLGNNNFQKVKEIINTYKNDFLFDNDNYASNDVVGAKVAVDYRWLHVNTTGNAYIDNTLNSNMDYGISVQFYFIPCRLARLSHSETNIYNLTNVNVNSTIEDYAYRFDLGSKFIELSSVTKTLNNKKNVTQYIYPNDYLKTTDFISALQDKNIIEKPIETVNYQTDLTNGGISILNGSINIYSGLSNPGLLTEQWTLDTSNPIPLASFNFSNQATGKLPFISNNLAFGKNSIYKQKYSFENDLNGKILNVKKIDDITTSYLWGYNNTYPIVKAVNIDNATLQAATTSIQSDLQNFLITNVGDLKTNTQKTAWTTFNVNLRNVATLKNALISTYTYKPSIGITSQTDPNGVTTYYEYDALGRLIILKDDAGRILKTFEYNYAH